MARGGSKASESEVATSELADAREREAALADVLGSWLRHRPIYRQGCADDEHVAGHAQRLGHVDLRFHPLAIAPAIGAVGSAFNRRSTILCTRAFNGANVAVTGTASAMAAI